MTATSAGRGKSASTGFSRPSLSTSANKVILQVDEAADGISSSIQITRFTVSSCPLISTSFFSSLLPQITVVTSVWTEENVNDNKEDYDRVNEKTELMKI